MITIGTLAKTFHLLPSEVAARATSYDVMVLDMMTAWDEYQNSRSSGSYVPELSQEQLLKIKEETLYGR